MPTWVCLLRGVNLGKRNKVPMAALRSALTDAGLTDVSTYLQSGNVITHSDLAAPDEVSNLLSRVIAAEFSLDIPVMTRTPADLARVIAENPFAAESAERAHLVRVIFLAGEPSAAGIGRLTAGGGRAGDTCRVIGRHVYVDYVDASHGMSRTASYFTRVLAVDGTERNWRTVLALSGLVS